MELTHDELKTVLHALHVAAMTLREDIKTTKAAGILPPNIVQIFEDSVKAMDDLYEKIEEIEEETL